ncbi:hypothetical protein BDV06DRAFT_228653 [Aspergillus oleicola]
MAVASPPSVERATLCCVLIHVIISSTIAFTSQRSLVRPIALATVVILAVCIQNIVVTWNGHRRVAVPYSLFASMNTLNATDLLLWTQVAYTEHREWTLKNPKTPPQKDILPLRIKWALQLPYNYRRIGTKWQVTPTHAFDPNRPDYIPSRIDFLLHRVLASLVSLLVLYYLGGAPFQNRFPGSVSLQQQRVLLDEWDFALDLLPVRFYLWLSFFLGLANLQSIGYSVLSVIMVILHVSDPEDFPPMQGSYLGAWSVRRLWGHTWHQWFRQFLTSNANFFTFTLLRLSPHTLLARYSRLFTSFFLSGLIHVLLDSAYGVPYNKSGALLFFTLQPFALGMEEIAQWFSKRYGIFMEDSLLRWSIRYVWVCAWCTLTWPIWVFPLMREPVAE